MTAIEILDLENFVEEILDILANYDILDEEQRVLARTVLINELN